jgi:hypothetical protein
LKWFRATCIITIKLECNSERRECMTSAGARSGYFPKEDSSLAENVA